MKVGQVIGGARSVGADVSPEEKISGLHCAYIQPVRAGNAFEETIDRVLQLIRLGIIEPGSRLPSERVLAARLSVSRATLREAIAELTKLGWVEVRRGRIGGTFVNRSQPDATQVRLLSSLTPEEVSDIVAVRYAIDTSAAEMAAMTDLSSRSRQNLLEFSRQLRECEPSDFLRCDSRLQMAIAEATDSDSIIRVSADTRHRLVTLLDLLPLDEASMQESTHEREEIVRAILAADGELARQLSVEHVQKTAGMLLSML